jgi:hypothetical protein
MLILTSLILTVSTLMVGRAYGVPPVAVSTEVTRVGNYACPAACTGPNGPYPTYCSGTVCLSTPTPSKSEAATQVD